MMNEKIKVIMDDLRKKIAHVNQPDLRMDLFTIASMLESKLESTERGQNGLLIDDMSKVGYQPRSQTPLNPETAKPPLGGTTAKVLKVVAKPIPKGFPPSDPIFPDWVIRLEKLIKQLEEKKPNVNPGWGLDCRYLYRYVNTLRDIVLHIAWLQVNDSQ